MNSVELAAFSDELMKIAADKEKPFWQKALPFAAAAGAGVLAYKGLRTPSFSKNPALRKVQELASSKGFHRIVDVTPDGTGGFLRPVADAQGKLSPLNKAKLFLNEGTTEAIPITYTPNQAGNYSTKVVGQKGPRQVEGVVHGRPDIYGRDKAVRGGVDVEGTPEVQRAMTNLAAGGKRSEADLLSKHAPEAIPETFTDLSPMFKKLPKDRQQAINELRNRIRAAHGENVLLKPNQGLSSGGKFPRSNQDWGAQLRTYDEHMADPVKRKAYRALKGEDNALADYSKEHGLYEGSVLHNALKDPKSMLAQKIVDNPMGEWRVHTVAGEAPRGLMTPRFASNPAKTLAARAGVGDASTKELQQFVEQDILQKLPKNYREGNYAFDVMPHRKPDGSIGFKTIEMNPAERAKSQSLSGGGSGFLDTAASPFSGLKHYRAVTGRHTPLVAGLGAAGAAGATGAVTGTVGE